MGKSKRALKGVMEYKDYVNKLTKEERKWVEQFYDEYEGGNAGEYEEPILTSPDMIKEANRNYNSLYRDAFNVSRTLGIQDELPADDRAVYELASDYLDFETAFMRMDYSAGVSLIMEQAIRDLDAGQNKKVVLSRYYVKMIRLNKLKTTEERKQR